MEFDSYDGRPVTLAVNLVNACRPPEGCSDDRLEDLIAAEGLADAHPRKPGDLDGLRALAAALRTVFATEHDAEAAAAVNRVLARVTIDPHLSDHDGTGWHLHFVPPEAGIVPWLSAMTGMALLLLLANDGAGRFGICAAEGCAMSYVDTTRNRSKRFCCEACATRTKVAAHRARQRGAG